MPPIPTGLRSVIGKLELDKTFEERAIINAQVVQAIDEAALNWGVKVLRYEIKDLTPPKEILHAMQQQITAEREKRALIAASEGRRQEQINIATGEREAFIARSEGEKQAVINNAQGQAAAQTHQISSQGAEDLRDTLEFLSAMRIRHQVRQSEAGQVPDNRVSPSELSNFERTQLKDAFKAVADQQAALAQRYQLARF